MRNPFRYFDSSPEVIRLAVTKNIRYPLSPWQFEDLLFERSMDNLLGPLLKAGMPGLPWFLICSFNRSNSFPMTARRALSRWRGGGGQGAVAGFGTYNCMQKY